MKFTSPTGSEIIGTLETIPGVAAAEEFDAAGKPEYSGSTEVDWDNQKTIERNGSLVYVDDDGAEWLFSDLTPVSAAKDE